MREIRPSGLMRGGECSGATDNFGQFNHLNCTLCLLYRGRPSSRASCALLPRCFNWGSVCFTSSCVPGMGVN